MEDLRVGRAVARRYRNRRIGEFLKEMELSEGPGTGIPKILRAMQANGSQTPLFESDEAQAELLATSFAALADPIRLRLLSYIAASDADEVCACDLTEPSGRSQPTVSHHMKILVDAGLIEREKRGLWVWYRLVPSRLDALRSVLG